MNPNDPNDRAGLRARAALREQGFHCYASPDGTEWQIRRQTTIIGRGQTVMEAWKQATASDVAKK